MTLHYFEPLYYIQYAQMCSKQTQNAKLIRNSTAARVKLALMIVRISSIWFEYSNFSFINCLIDGTPSKFVIKFTCESLKLVWLPVHFVFQIYWRRRNPWTEITCHRRLNWTTSQCYWLILTLRYVANVWCIL